MPTLRLTAPVFYYQGRVHAGLGSPESVQQYERFLSIKKGGDEQGLVADARRRFAAR